MAIELVELRRRFESGEEDPEGKISQRLTDLEDVFATDEERSDGPSGVSWIDEKLKDLMGEGPEIKEYDFAGGS
jgi:hypothetical protein